MQDTDHDLGRQGPESAEPPFPSARYFQIHFEYLESLLKDAKEDLQTLRQQLPEAGIVRGDLQVESSKASRMAGRVNPPSTTARNKSETMEKLKNRGAPSLLLSIEPASKQ